MTTMEWVVIAVGGLGGYGLVSFLMQGRAPDDAARPTAAVEPAPGWAEVLQLPPGADIEAIRAAYKRMLAHYHPDKVATLGPELQALATAKSQQIVAAYQAALRDRGARP